MSANIPPHMSARVALLAPNCFAHEVLIADLASHDTAEAAAQALGLGLPPQLSRAVPGRRFEFVAGRLCAQQALKMAGYSGTAEVTVDERRAPVWPPGYTGSIAHGIGRAWAMVASKAHYRALGIDLEEVVTPATALQLSSSVLRPEEREWARTTTLSHEQFLSLAFSAKESLFKCLDPMTRAGFDFQDVGMVDVDLSAGLLRLELRVDLSSEFSAGNVFEVRFHLDTAVHTATGIAA